MTMTSTQIATGLLRNQYKAAHDWLEASMDGVTDEVATWQPQGRANPIGASYLHHISAEDAFVQMVLAGGTPLLLSTFADKTGGSAPYPMEFDWADWARGLKVDVAAAREYARAVYAATDAYLADLTDDDLDRELDLSAVGLGTMTLSTLLSMILGDCQNHCGEIASVKGLQGLQGYPF